jgi:membrane fusion protein (multidrug efflux system)
MKRVYFIAGAVLMTACVAGAGWHFAHATTRASTPVEAADGPVVTVRTAAIVKANLVRRISAFGEVGPGQVIGMSFPRAGQVTRLLVTPGRYAAKGTPLAALAPDPATQQAYQQAVTAADLARREWQRLQDLLKLQLATQSQVDTAEKAHRDAVGNVKALEQIGGGSAESVVVAPFDGTVVSVAVAQGDRIAAGSPVLQFGHTDVMKVFIGIEPSARRLIAAGTRVSIVPLGSADAKQTTIDATISEVQDTVDPKSMLVTAVVLLRGAAAGGLVPGVKVRASVDAETVSATAVPRNAVLIDEKGSYVFQVVDGKALRSDVTTGLLSDGLVAIEGLEDPSRPVVVLGNYELEDGMTVKVEAP